MSIVVVEDLYKKYEKVTALDYINFTVNEGEIFGLIGPDGAGKTTLFNILTTLILPTSGKATLMGLDIFKDYKKIRNHIGYLPGTFSLYPDLSINENLTFFATMYGVNKEENMKLVAPIWNQISQFGERLAGRLSGGMKQKLALCCALIHRPKILFLDEPTTGVDPVSRREFWDLLKEVKKFVTVIVSTPYMDEATYCDRIALLQTSKIITINSPKQIVANYNGHLHSLKTTSLFQLLELMESFDRLCSYYPYGEYLHISFYGNIDEDIPYFTQFLEQNQVEYSTLKPIEPIIEDCFIELVNASSL